MDQRVCVVTGAAAGIGRATAQRLLADGWAVVAVDVDAAGLDPRDLDPDGAPGRLTTVVGDVAERATADRAARAAAGLGPLGGWVNNAGVQVPQAVHEVDEPALNRQLGINLVGTVWGCAAAVAAMRGAGGGAIVNLGSVQGRQPLADTAVYAATKGAVGALTRQLAGQYAADGIRVNAVLPGAIRTPMNQAQWAAAPDSAAAESEAAWLAPTGRVGEPAEVAAAIAWLLSAQASFVTGIELIVDGGATARLQSSRPA